MWWLLALLVCGCASLYDVCEKGEEGKKKTRKKRAIKDLPPVDQAVVIDLAIAALKMGASVPLLLKILNEALDEEKHPSELSHVGQVLVMGSSWEEAWDGIDVRFNPLRDALEPAWLDGIEGIPLLARTVAAIRAKRVERSREAAARLGIRLVMPFRFMFFAFIHNAGSDTCYCLGRFFSVYILGPRNIVIVDSCVHLVFSRTLNHEGIIMNHVVRFANCEAQWRECYEFSSSALWTNCLRLLCARGQ